MIFPSENPARFTEKPWDQSNSTATVHIDFVKTRFSVAIFG